MHVWAGESIPQALKTSRETTPLRRNLAASDFVWVWQQFDNAQLHSQYDDQLGV